GRSRLLLGGRLLRRGGLGALRRGRRIGIGGRGRRFRDGLLGGRFRRRGVGGGRGDGGLGLAHDRAPAKGSAAGRDTAAGIGGRAGGGGAVVGRTDRKSTRLNSSHVSTSYAVFCLKKKINVDEIRMDQCRDGP